MPAEVLSYLEHVRSRREAGGSHRRGPGKGSDLVLVTCTWLLWAGGMKGGQVSRRGGGSDVHKTPTSRELIGLMFCSLA